MWIKKFVHILLNPILYFNYSKFLIKTNVIQLDFFPKIDYSGFSVNGMDCERKTNRSPDTFYYEVNLTLDTILCITSNRKKRKVKKISFICKFSPT